jgi:hypothetical protein
VDFDIAYIDRYKQIYIFWPNSYQMVFCIQLDFHYS